MQKSPRFHFRSLVPVMVSVVILGCGNAHVGKFAPQEEAAIDEKLAEEIFSDSIPESDHISQAGSVDDLLRAARQLCDEGRYVTADSILRSAVKLLGQEIENAESEWFPSDDYINDVVAIYTEKMPPEYPIPDDIAALVFQRQIQRSLDSLQITPDDSAKLARLSCNKEVTYEVPVVWNERVQRSLLFYMGRKEMVERLVNRAYYYLPVLKKMFADSGLPQDLAYLPIIESAFNPVAYSRAHAAGIWQFIPSTGRLYRLRHNYWIDERRDPVKSTLAAISYLKKLYGDFNDWHLALAAYNCGEGGLGRAIKRCQVRDYWQLTLPRETMNYVPQYLASLIVAKNPDCFGYAITQRDTFQRDTVLVSDCIDMGDIARGIGVDADTLRKMNPHILHWCTPPDMADVRLYLPLGSAQTFSQFYSSLPDEKKVKWYRYRIRRGDNISTIARQFRLPVDAIKSVNRMKNNRIVAGRHLFIPIPVGGAVPAVVSASAPPVGEHDEPAVSTTGNRGRVRYRVRKGDTLWSLARLFSTTPEQIARWNNRSKHSGLRAGEVISIYRSKAGAAPEPEPERTVSGQETRERAEAGTYVVKPGDTPYSIARETGTDLKQLLSQNGLDQDKPVIRPGDTLRYGNGQPTAQPPVRRVAVDFPSDQIRYVVSKGDNLYRISRNFSVSIENLRALNSLGSDAVLSIGDTLVIRPGDAGGATSRAGAIRYEVQPGDNLWKIATSFGVRVEDLCRLNGLTPDSVLKPGDTLRVEGKGDQM